MNADLVIDEKKSTFSQSGRGEKLYGQLEDFINLGNNESLSLTLDTNLQFKLFNELKDCLLYTSDAADE